MDGVSDNGALARALYDMETAPSAVRVILEEGPLPATVAIVLRKRVRVKENIDRRLTDLPYARTSQLNVGKVRRMQQSNFAFGHPQVLEVLIAIVAQNDLGLDCAWNSIWQPCVHLSTLWPGHLTRLSGDVRTCTKQIVRREIIK